MEIAESKIAFLCDCNVVECRSTTKSIIAAVRFLPVSVRERFGSVRILQECGSFRQPVRTGSDHCRCGSYRFGSYGALSRRRFGSVQADRFGSEAILQEIHEFECASKNRESFLI